MVKMINATTGGDMWVAEGRVIEYEALGCKLVTDEAQGFAGKTNDLISKMKTDVDEPKEKLVKKPSKTMKKTR